MRAHKFPENANFAPKIPIFALQISISEIWGAFFCKIRMFAEILHRISAEPAQTFPGQQLSGTPPAQKLFPPQTPEKDSNPLKWCLETPFELENASK